MLLRVVALLFVLSTFGTSALAQDVQMFKIGDPGCDYSASTFWVELAPGERREFTADMSACHEDDLGFYKFYGYRFHKKSAEFLMVKDGVVLEVRDLVTGDVHTSSGMRRHREEVFLKVSQPTQYLLSAENTKRKAALVRFTWTSLSMR